VPKRRNQNTSCAEATMGIFVAFIAITICMSLASSILGGNDPTHTPTRRAQIATSTRFIAPIKIHTPVPLFNYPTSPPFPYHTQVPVNPASGATALCRDGTYSYSATHNGTCSYHGGVVQWYK
jgi:hypothetical protein